MNLFLSVRKKSLEMGKKNILFYLPISHFFRISKQRLINSKTSQRCNFGVHCGKLKLLGYALLISKMHNAKILKSMLVIFMAEDEAENQMLWFTGGNALV